MPRPGGESGKLGDQYEGAWTVDQLIELCLGGALQICVEEVGAEFDGVEFRLIREDGVSSFHSVKRQRSNGEWSLAKLAAPSATGRSILGDLFKKLREHPSACCVFVSATGANDLREACEVARKCETAEDFDRLMQGMRPLQRELEERLVNINALADWTEVHGLLRRIRVVLKDPTTLRDDVEERLRAHFARSDLNPIHPADERRALGELVLDKLGVPLTAGDVLGYLENRGIVRRNSLAQPEPGLRSLPSWFLGEPNRYIARPRVEAQVLDLLKKCPDERMPRLITIHGFGGIGKTRLAIACALQAVGLFEDVFFVRLDNRLPTKESVAEAIGEVLNRIGEAARPDKIIEILREQNALLLLDNFETVDCDDTRQLIGRLVKETRHLRLLVTGRETVKLDDAECLVNLDDPLNEMTEPEARELFVERAKQKLGRQWSPDQRQEAAIHRIMELTDHIPLAIELAAAWTRHRSLDEIADGLAATPLGEPTTELPRHGRTGSTDRHSSLARCLDWSFNLLESDAQDALARFGVFADSFTASTAADVCDLPSAQTMLYRLHDASLMRRFETIGQSRYEFNRFARSYAAEKLSRLSDADTIRRRFVAHYRRLVATNDRDVTALPTFAVEWLNAIAAAETAEQLRDWVGVGSISAHLEHFLMLYGHWSECERLQERALCAARSARNRAAEGVALNSLGSVYLAQGRLDEARYAIEQSLAIMRRFGRKWMAVPLANLGTVYISQSQWSDATAVHQQCLQIARRLGDRDGEQSSLKNLGIIYKHMGRWGKAEKAFRQSLAIAQTRKDRERQAHTLSNLSHLYGAQSRWVEAEAACTQALDIWRACGDRVREGLMGQSLAKLRAVQGDLSAALAVAREALTMLETTQDEAEKENARKLIATLEAELNGSLEPKCPVEDS